VRRLPGPAISPLCEGDQTPEAHHELFRDWQRTQTQSSATAPSEPEAANRCLVLLESRNHRPRGHGCDTAHPGLINARSPKRATDTCAFLLTLTYIDVGNPSVILRQRPARECGTRALASIGMSAHRHPTTNAFSPAVRINPRKRLSRRRSFSNGSHEIRVAITDFPVLISDPGIANKQPVAYIRPLSIAD
jgi:hypothetical protein